MKPVRKVVFPVNGLGTRFLPATKAMPKEMLPIVDKPLIQYAVEEAETKGKAEGERLATLRNARNMKKAGVDLSLIAECTGLSLEIIQSL